MNFSSAEWFYRKGSWFGTDEQSSNSLFLIDTEGCFNVDNAMLNLGSSVEGLSASLACKIHLSHSSFPHQSQTPTYKLLWCTSI